MTISTTFKGANGPLPCRPLHHLIIEQKQGLETKYLCKLNPVASCFFKLSGDHDLESCEPTQIFKSEINHLVFKGYLLPFPDQTIDNFTSE